VAGSLPNAPSSTELERGDRDLARRLRERRLSRLAPAFTWRTPSRPA